LQIVASLGTHFQKNKTRMGVGLPVDVIRWTLSIQALGGRWASKPLADAPQGQMWLSSLRHVIRASRSASLLL